jgi:CheY-like chemotaxis protein
MIIDVGQDILKTLGYHTLAVRSGREALDLVSRGRDTIDLVILDMVMPEMGGSETFDRMKEIDPDIKVLLSSGYSIDGEANEILKRGCNGFIQKPFRLSDLSQKLREILD